MTETRAVINVDINTAGAAAELRRLQSQLNAFQSSLSSSNRVQAQAAKNLSLQLREAVNATQMFSAETVRMRTSAGRLDDALSKGKGSISQYFNSFRKGSTEAAQVMSLAHARASALQTQFVATGAAAGGYREALAIRPLSAFNATATVSAEKLGIQRAMLTQASTQMINFGKNTQWAGRQLMVGFTVPLTIFGTIAGKTYMELEKQAISFKKVYGDSFTTPQELQENLDAVKVLSEEYTKFGIAASKTMELAAQAAAMGAQGATLTDAITESTKLATLGQMEQTEALETTIALQNAFGLSGEKLAKSVNFLNMVENQTVLTLQDLAEAIPRVSPVIKGLGGTVEDMAAMLAAMKEGGVSAAQGANALKSGLASLINPTDKAVERLKEMGINLETIIRVNRGDLLGTVQAFGKALSTLDEFGRQQALEKVFGKYQYARLGALFNNIVKDGTQASRVLDMASMSAEELQAVANKELKVISDSPATRMTAAIEKLKLSIAPLGEMFIKFAIPVVELFTRILKIFDGLPDGVKKIGAIGAIIVGVVIPAGTMFLGLLLNLMGTLVKFGHIVGVTFKGLLTGGLSGAIKAVSQSLKYMSLAEIDAAGASMQLGESTLFVNAALKGQISASDGANVAIVRLAESYAVLRAQMQMTAEASPTMFGIGNSAAVAASGAPSRAVPRRLRRNSGGSIPYLSNGNTVPGSGNTDTVPAMLTPGEFVINKKATEKNLPLLYAINDGNTPPGFNRGGQIPGVQYAGIGNIISKIFGSKPKPPKPLSAYDTPPTEEETARILANWPQRPVRPMAYQSQAVATAGKSKGIYGDLTEKYLPGTNSKVDTLRFMVDKLGFSPAALGLQSHGNFVLGFSKSTNLAMAGKNPTLTRERLLAELVDSNGQVRRGVYSPLEQQMSSYFRNGQAFDHDLFDNIFRGQVALSKEPISNKRFEKISRNALREYLRAKDYSGPDSRSFIKDILSKDTVRGNASKTAILSSLTARGIPYETNGKDVIATIDGVRYNFGSVAGREMGSLGRPEGIRPYGDLEMSPGDERVHANKGGMIPGVQYFGWNPALGILNKQRVVQPRTFTHFIKGAEPQEDLVKPEALIQLEKILGQESRLVSGAGLDLDSRFGINEALLHGIEVKNPDGTVTRRLLEGREIKHAISKSNNPYGRLYADHSEQEVKKVKTVFDKMNDDDQFNDNSLDEYIRGNLDPKSSIFAAQGFRLSKGIGIKALKKIAKDRHVYREHDETTGKGTRHVAVELEDETIISYETRGLGTAGGINQQGGPNYKVHQSLEAYTEWASTQGRTTERMRMGGIVPGVPGLSTGALFLGMPHPFKSLTRSNEIRETLARTNILAQSGRSLDFPLMQTGSRVSGLGGHSSNIPGNGIYDMKDGRYVLKFHDTLESTLTEAAASSLTRNVFGLESPLQEVIRVPHPDTGDLVFAVRSKYDEAFAQTTGSFEKESFSKQLIASLIRRDSDLSAENVYGNKVADVGAAIFGMDGSGKPRASMPRIIGEDPISVLEQLDINMLMKSGGGAKKHFAESTADIARSMTESEYVSSMKATISRARLNAEEAGSYLPGMSQLEKARYLKTLNNDFDNLDTVDWAEVYKHHIGIYPATKRPPTPASLKKKEEERVLRARQAGHNSPMINGMSFVNGGGMIPGIQQLMAGARVKSKAPIKAKAPTKLPIEPPSELTHSWEASGSDPAWDLSPAVSYFLRKNVKPTKSSSAEIKFLQKRGIDTKAMEMEGLADRWNPKNGTAKDILDTQYELNMEEGIPLIAGALKRGATDEELVASILASQSWHTYPQEELSKVISRLSSSQLNDLANGLTRLPENHQLRSLISGVLPEVKALMKEASTAYRDPDLERAFFALASMKNQGGMIPGMQYFATRIPRRVVLPAKEYPGFGTLSPEGAVPRPRLSVPPSPLPRAVGSMTYKDWIGKKVSTPLGEGIVIYAKPNLTGAFSLKIKRKHGTGTMSSNDVSIIDDEQLGINGYAHGGQIFESGPSKKIVPGVGNTDTVPAMLTPGEFVINKKATSQNMALLHSINNGNTPLGFNKGGRIPGVQHLINGGIMESMLQRMRTMKASSQTQQRATSTTPKSKTLRDMTDDDYNANFGSILKQSEVEDQASKTAFQSFNIKKIDQDYIFKGYGQEVPLSAIGKNNVLGITPEELLLEALMHRPNDKKLIKMLNNINNKRYGKNEKRLLDDIAASISIDRKGKMGAQEDAAGYAQVLASLMGDPQATRLLSLKRKALYSELDQIKRRKQKQSRSNPQDTDATWDDKVIIHSTARGVNIDKKGNALIYSAGDATRGTPGSYPRSTVHTTINAAVKSHMAGTWADSNQLIVGNARRVLSSNNPPSIINVIDTVFPLNPGQPLRIPNASVVTPMFDAEKYKRLLMERKLVSNDEKNLPFIVNDDKTNDVIYFIKKEGTYTDDDRAAILKATGSHARPESIIGRETDILKEEALTRAMRQQKVEGGPQTLSQWSTNNPDFDRGVNRLAAQRGIGGAIHDGSPSQILEMSAINDLWYTSTSPGGRFNDADIYSIRHVVASGHSKTKQRPLSTSDDFGGPTLNKGGFISPTLKMNNGNIVPGMGSKDTVPAMLTPGEFVINKKATSANMQLLRAINNGTLRGYTQGAHIGFDENGNKITNPKTARTRMSQGRPIYANIGDTHPMNSGQVDTAIARRGTPTRGRTPPVGRGGAFSMGLGTVGGAMMMASMLPMMMPGNPETGEPGKFLGLDSGTASMAMMGAGTAAMLAPLLKMIPGVAALGAVAIPALAVAAALAAVGGALYLWRKNVDESARRAATLGANLGGAANALGNMSKILGVESPLDRRRNLQLSVAPEQQELSNKFTQSFTEGEGKAFIDKLKTLTSEKQFSMLSDYIKVAIASGMMDRGAAEVFAKSVGSELKNVALATQGIATAKGAGVGSKAMLALAQKREETVSKNAEIQMVLNSNIPDSVNSASAAKAIAASTQIMKDFSAAQVLAEEELRNNTLSYEEYRKIVDLASEATKTWKDAIDKSNLNTDDAGATTQGSIESMILAGMSPEQIAIIQNATDVGQANKGFGAATTYQDEGKTKNIESGSFADVRLLDKVRAAGFSSPGEMVAQGNQSEYNALAKTAVEEQSAALTMTGYDPKTNTKIGTDFLQTAMEVAIAGGMDSTQAFNLVKNILADPLGAAATHFTKAGLNAQSFTESLSVANAEIDIPNLSDSQQTQYEDISNSLLGGFQEQFRTYIASSTNPAVALKNFEEIGAGRGRGRGLTGNELDKARSKFFTDQEKMGRGSIANTVQSSQAYKDALQERKTVTEQRGRGANKTYQAFDSTGVDKISNAVVNAQKSEVSESVITYAVTLNGEEVDVANKINELTLAHNELIDLPEDFILGIGLDLTNGADVESFGKISDDLKMLIPTLDALPEEARAIMVNFGVKENGKAMSPEAFAKKSERVLKALKNLDSTKKSVKKSAIVSLLQEIKVNGKTMSKEAADSAYSDLIDKYGEKKIMNLPGDVLHKVIMIETEIQGLNEYINKLNSVIASDLGGASPEERRARNALQAKVAAAKNIQRATIASGLDAGGDSGGGGGGEKSIMQQLKKEFNDLKKVYNSMQQFINSKKGQFKGIMAGPFGPEFIEYLKSQGEQGLKILNGGINKIKAAYEAFKKVQTQNAINFARELPASLNRQRKNLAIQTNFEERLEKAGFDKEQTQAFVEEIKGPEGIRNYLNASKKNKGARTTEEQELVVSINQAIKKGGPAAKQLSVDQINKEAGISLDDMDKEIKNMNKLTALAYTQEEAEQIANLGDVSNLSANDINKLGNRIREYNREVLASNPKALAESILQNRMEINNLQRQIAEINTIDPLEKELKILQDQNDASSRAIELKQRELEPLDEQIEKLQELSDKNSEVYDNQIEALDKIYEREAQIDKLKQGQLNVAQALSRGDVAGAAQAAMAVSQDIAERSRQEARSALEAKKEADKKNIERQILAIQIQRTVIEDKIKSMQLVQRGIQDQIYNKQYQINVETARLDDLYNNAKDELKLLNDQLLIALDRQKELAGITFKPKTDSPVLETTTPPTYVPSPDGQPYYPNASIGSDVNLSNDGSRVIGGGAAPAAAPSAAAPSTAGPSVEAERARAAEARAAEARVAEVRAAKARADQVTLSAAAAAAAAAAKQKAIEAGAAQDKAKATANAAQARAAESARQTAAAQAAAAAAAKAAEARAAEERAKLLLAQGNRAAAARAANRAFGGFISKYAMGGRVNYKGSTEPPPRMMNYGGMMKKYAYGSMVPGMGMTDKVPALLTPGEFVIRKSVVESYGPMLSALNSQVFPKMNMTSAMPSTEGNENEGTVYNYQVSVALNGSNLDPNDVANAVMQKIKMSESRNIRSNNIRG